MRHILDDYDDDKNGQVSNAEFVHHFAAIAASNPGLNVIAKGLFLEFDMDHDGEITYTDLDLYYQKIDTNDNWHVEESEFVHYFTEVRVVLLYQTMQRTIQNNCLTDVKSVSGCLLLL
ncbi:hypothetical protein FSP39_000074 [Pinctada imbricata]|uniref:EF-hand domain-containing protein n=1 Tax=Pinctada imbricata TaxID=66713 RepID=A0AA88XJM6_PINIB|nr:hypothetical protein FSP39_000074 [Pinctada imbricata]